MQTHQLSQFLQLNDSLFPTGAFAFSDGLESAVFLEYVQSVEDLSAWLSQYLQAVFMCSEGLAVLKVLKALDQQDWSEVMLLDAQCHALKPAEETRASGVSLGKRLYKSALPLYPHAGLLKVEQMLTQHQLHGQLPVIYAILMQGLGFSTAQILTGFGYTRLAGAVSAAMRLMSIGQAQGQLALSKALEELEQCVKQLEQRQDAPLQSFTPVLDVIQMRHHFLYSRLFRS